MAEPATGKQLLAAISQQMQTVTMTGVKHSAYYAICKSCAFSPSGGQCGVSSEGGDHHLLR